MLGTLLCPIQVSFQVQEGPKKGILGVKNIDIYIDIYIDILFIIKSTKIMITIITHIIVVIIVTWFFNTR